MRNTGPGSAVLPVDQALDQIGDLLQAGRRRVEFAAHSGEVAVDLFEVAVDLFEVAADLFEVAVDLLEAAVDLFETPVDLFETPVHLLSQVDEIRPQGIEACGRRLPEITHLGSDFADVAVGCAKSPLQIILIHGIETTSPGRYGARLASRSVDNGVGDNACMVETSIWMTNVAADPEHSHRYVERFRAMARAGDDLAGEARLVDAMAPRCARILDAGCGPGRVGGHLARAGHRVVGVDVDPALIEAAEHDHPGPRWLVGDLAELNLPDRFDLIVSAGNVMAFLAPSTRVGVLSRLRAHLDDDGRAVIGFGAGRGYEFGQFLQDAAAGGWAADLLLSTWDVRPFTDDSDFLVAVLRPV